MGRQWGNWAARVALAGVIAAHALMATPSSAQQPGGEPALGTVPPQPAILEKLRKQPLTMLDWGLYRLERDLNAIAEDVAAEVDGLESYTAGSLYDFRNGRLMLYLTAVAFPETRTQAVCERLFAALVDRLTEGGPGSSERVSNYLVRVFSGFGGGVTLHDLRRQLADVVWLRVNLLGTELDRAAGDNANATCLGPLDAKPAALQVEVVP